MSEALDGLLAAKHSVSANDARNLPTEDLDALATIIADRANPSRLQAMSILTRAAPLETPAILGSVLGLPSEDPVARAAAAAHLGSFGGGAAAQALLTTLPTITQEDALLVLRAQIAAGLGKIGDTEALDPLGALVNDVSPLVARQARFAQTLIAFRAGTSGFEPPTPDPSDLAAPPPDDAQPIFVDAGAPDASTAVSNLQDAGDTFGLQLDVHGARSLQCLDFTLALLFDQTVLDRGLPSLALARPVLAGLVALRHDASLTWSTRWLVLAWPPAAGSNPVNVALHRPDGKQVMFGSGSSDTATLSFALRGVRDTGNAPIQFDGRFTGADLIVDAAASALTLFGQDEPDPMDLP